MTLGANHATLTPILLLLSGPNLNMLGERQPEIYGAETLQQHVVMAQEEARAHGLTLKHVQSNAEGDLVTEIQRARNSVAAIIINAGALTHYAWALHDALSMFEGPIIELHLSNPAAGEPFRHTSVLAPVVSGSIAGFGGLGYKLAVKAATEMLQDRLHAEDPPPGGQTPGVRWS